MGWFLTALFVAVGALLGGAFAFGWTAMSRKALDSQREMWRLGAEAGPTAQDRESARRRHAYATSTYARWMTGALAWWFRILLPVFGAICGLAVAQKVGVLE